MPAGLLKNTLYHFDRTKYINYGAIGTIIGHEMTHGFDNEGIKFDKDEKYREWSNKIVEEKMKEKLNCLQDLYSNYTVSQVGQNVSLLPIYILISVLLYFRIKRSYYIFCYLYIVYFIEKETFIFSILFVI